MKLGKLPAKQDERNIKFRALLPRKLPTPPPEYDVDFNSDVIWPLPLPQFANDKWGCCVIAGRANMTLRFEKIEQGLALPITDQDILREYWMEQGDPEGKENPDNGLYVLESLKTWRSQGWLAAGQRYDIYAFAEINPLKHNETMLADFLLGGCMTGVLLPLTAQDQIEKKQIWTVGTGPKALRSSWGGHCMYRIGYTRTGPVFLTWGQRQQATWEWWNRYVDECYGVVDNRNKFLSDSPVDVEKLDGYLKQLGD